MTAEHRRTTMRAVGGVQLGIGIAAVFAPRQLAAVFGMDPARLNGEGLVGWRLFGIRQVLLGTGNAMLDASTNRGNLAIGALDLGLFATTLRSGSVPRRTSLMALATAASVTLSSLASRSWRDMTGLG